MSLRAGSTDLSLCVTRRADVALERLGFQLLAVDLDLDAGTVRVEAKRFDGYLLTLDWRNGAGSITREWVRGEVIAVSVPGARADDDTYGHLSNQQRVLVAWDTLVEVWHDADELRTAR